MLITNQIENFISETVGENEEYRDVFLSGIDAAEETAVLSPDGEEKAFVYSALADYYGERALCLASSSLSAKQVETATDETITLFEMVGDDYDDYAMQVLERELKGKEIVMIFAAEKMPLDAIRFVITAIDNVSIRFGKQIKMAFFVGAGKPQSAMALEYVKAFAHRPVHVFDLLQCKQACEAKAEAC